jgi:serpin B
MQKLIAAALTVSTLFLAYAPTLGGGEGTGAAGEAVEAEPKDTAVGYDRIAAGNTRFAFDLYREIKGKGNLFFSPYSVSTALAMTYAGARGETEREMAEVLGFPVPEPSDTTAEGDARASARREVAAAFAALEEGLAADPETHGYSLYVANALWGDQNHPFLESYTAFVDEHFDAPLTLLDFESDTEGARVRINAWVEKRTRERIRDLIPRGTLTPVTTLVLTNAIYFKGHWVLQFDPKRTRDAEFHGLAGTATVPMMSRKGDYGYYEDEEAKVLEMPYEGGDLSMVVLLPKIEGAVGLEAVERALTPERLDSWIAGLREQEVAVSIPRFEMTWGTEELKGALRALGMSRAFDPANADFSGMSEGGGLFIGYVLHKAFIEVNEEGTEAAAATAVGMLKASWDHLSFRADRPFVFMIRDTGSGSILFLGRITDLGE